MQGKRGYVIPVPALVVAIGIIMLAYLYFLPLNDKCSLIPGLSECEGGYAENVLSVSPGLLEIKDLSKRYNIPSSQLFRIDDLEVAEILGNSEVSRGWFSVNPREAEFPMHEGGRGMKIFLFVSSAEGKLNVIINGKTVSRVKGIGVQEISVPSSVLKEKNTLKIVPSIPFLPWSKNTYSISKAIVKESYTKTYNQASYALNLEQDINDARKAVLSFDTECFSDDNLTVTLNGEEIVEGKICYGFEKDVKKYLKQEGNKIIFSSEGNYLVNNAYVDLQMKEAIWPTYYFDISERRLDDKSPIFLNLRFNESGEKELSIYLNGASISAKTNKLAWRTSINRFLNDGKNSIMFIPRTEMILDRAEIE